MARGRPLTRGLGRSYGDASLPPAGALEVAGSALADRLLAFDPESGVLRAEAGLSLREILRLFLPRGFWPPASPGTAFVTLGGMVAADVHGKSHHRDGSFGRHVRALRLLLADGRIVDCDRATQPELFRATLGGMGLTGHILEVELTLQRVPSAWIVEERRRYDGLDELLAALRAAAADWPYTVAWIDTLTPGKALGRGILFAGRWAEAGEAPLFPPPPRPRRRFPLRSAGVVPVAVRGAAVQRRRSSARRPPGRSGACSRRSSSSIRSTSSRTGTGCTAGAASRSTSASCPRASARARRGASSS